MLVDTGSSSDILYLCTFDKLQLPWSLLQSLHTPLIGFIFHSVYAMGVVTLDFTVGAGTKMKFTTPGGIGEICGDQKRAQICYQTSVALLNKGKNELNNKWVRENHMEVNVMRNEEEEDNSPKEREYGKKGEPHEDVENVPFKKEIKDKTFRIGMNFGEKHKQRLISLVREYEDVFAWGPEDMSGIDLAIAVHRWYVDTTFLPIKQKKRNFSDEKNLVIREEVQTLVKANTIRELKFRNWIANVVLVKKPNNK
ncbi:hypothetical protein LIER_12543 [Lithospermum erythrorhizon]|uniref:Uncharacterized protein n=1 Tax=Lithospermum erythrorhizon TaxID=34254 RepID=A0AAV3PWA1_LITER